MLRDVFTLASAAFVGLLPMFGQTAAVSPVPSDDEIRKILSERIDRDHRAVGLVVGVIDGKGRRVISYGSLAKDDKRPLNGDTIFEIGSVTKVFTSLILMDMVQKGEVALTDPVAKYLPERVKVPERNGKKITLADLSTQTSGLARMPNNLRPKDMANPYADYTVDQMYEFLSGYQLPRDIGEKYEYSNLGVGLLGHALARRAGLEYEAMVKARVLEPLGMKSTAITLTPEMKARFATGHDGKLQPTPAWDIPTLAGAGALRSTANDMLTFLAANLGYAKTPLADAMAAEVSVRKPTGMPGMEIAYAWHVLSKEGRSVIWHNGGTGGYRSFVGFDPQTRAGVVVLSNASMPEGGDDIGRHLLDASFPLATFGSKDRKSISLESKVLENYTGRYELAPSFVLNVTRDGDHLYGQATRQGRFEIFAESEKEFFAKVAEVQISFKTGADGKATELVLHQNGMNTPGKRIGDAEKPKERKVVSLAPAVLDGYVGRYQVTPAMVLTVSRDGDRLFTQATGQPRFEVFAESEKEFFVKAFEAQLSFKTDASGVASEVVLHQGGMDIPCKRIAAER
jgi:CubicO group peptidase (beta-lactamase class C family)